jgi:hypothetical protein
MQVQNVDKFTDEGGEDSAYNQQRDSRRFVPITTLYIIQPGRWPGTCDARKYSELQVETCICFLMLGSLDR